METMEREVQAVPDVDHVMIVLDGTGDTKIKWNARRPDEVAAARAHFNTLKEKQYLAFKTRGNGETGEQLHGGFDPSIEEITMVPRSVGG